MLDTSVIDQNIDATKLCFGKFHHVLNIADLAHICRVVRNFDFASFNCCFGGCDITKSIHDNIGAFFGECNRES